MAQLDLDFQRLPSQQHEVKIGWKVPSGSSETKKMALEMEKKEEI